MLTSKAQERKQEYLMTRSGTIKRGKFWQFANTEAPPYMWQDVFQDLQWILEIASSTGSYKYYIFSIHTFLCMYESQELLPSH